MHELSIALSVVEGTLQELEKLGAGRAKAIHLRVGRLSGVDREALLFSYQLASHETSLRDTRLVIEDVEVTIHCPRCQTERCVERFPTLQCPECGSLADELVHGQELEITALEVET
jgi:hydrogenase nickel incorporation protein HypA/HybF